MEILTRILRMAASAHAGADSAHWQMAETGDKAPMQCASRTPSEARGLPLPPKPQEGLP